MFIIHFYIYSLEDGTVTKRKFNLEKVGQYLENTNLPQPAKSDMHHRWNKLLDENDCLRNCPFMYSHDKKLSLIQQRNKLTESIERIIDKPNQSITEHFSLKTTLICCDLPKDFTSNDQIKTTFHVHETFRCEILLITISRTEILLIELDARNPYLKSTHLNLKPGPFTHDLSPSYGNLSFVDLKFYNEHFISILLQNYDNSDRRTQSYFLQLPLDLISGKYKQHQVSEKVNLTEATASHSILDFLDVNCLKHVDGFCTSIAVSGMRKVKYKFI